MKKIPAQFTPLVLAFYMALMMAFLMSAAIVGLHTGFGPHYLASVFRAYVVAMPIAFCCVLFVRPLAVRLLACTVESGPH